MELDRLTVVRLVGPEEGLSGKISSRFKAVRTYDIGDENHWLARDRSSVPASDNSESALLVNVDNTAQRT